MPQTLVNGRKKGPKEEEEAKEERVGPNGASERNARCGTGGPLGLFARSLLGRPANLRAGSLSCASATLSLSLPGQSQMSKQADAKARSAGQFRRSRSARRSLVCPIKIHLINMNEQHTRSLARSLACSWLAKREGKRSLFSLILSRGSRWLLGGRASLAHDCSATEQASGRANGPEAKLRRPLGGFELISSLAWAPSSAALEALSSPVASNSAAFEAAQSLAKRASERAGLLACLLVCIVSPSWARRNGGAKEWWLFGVRFKRFGQCSRSSSSMGTILNSSASLIWRRSAQLCTR